jgi:hypothetical protein
MLPLLVKNQQGIAALCHRHGVERLFVFGSALRSDFRAGVSDVDLLVDFQPMSPGRKAQEFFSIRQELCQLLDVEVDLVMAGAVRNRIISREIEATKQLVYGA